MRAALNLAGILKGASAVGSLSAISTISLLGEDLTAAGFLDYLAIKQLVTGGDDQVKSGVGLISAISLTNATRAGNAVDLGVTNSWTDGSPTASGSSSEVGKWSMTSTGSDTFVDLTVPAGTASRKVGVAAGMFYSSSPDDGTVNLRLTLSDASASDTTKALSRIQGADNPPTFQYYEATYNAASAGQTLRVRFEMLTSGASGTGPQLFVALVRYGS